MELDEEGFQKSSCYLYSDLQFFDLRGLRRGDDNSEGKYKVGNYEFNFCKYLGDNIDEKTYAIYVPEGEQRKDGIRLTDDSVLPVNINGAVNEQGSKHIQFTRGGGEICKVVDGQEVRYSVLFDIVCKTEGGQGTPSKEDISLDDTDKCQPKITIQHKSGCPVIEATSIVLFLSKHTWIGGILLILGGLVVTYYGQKFFDWTLAIVSGAIVLLFVLILASNFGTLDALTNKEASVAPTIITFLVAFGLAFLAGWFLKSMLRIGGSILGAVGGFFLGFMVYNIFLGFTESFALLLVCTLGFTIAGFVVTYKFFEQVIIYLTSFLGAYALIRGVAVFAGHYPNEIFIYQQLLSSEGIPTFEWQVYLYMASFVAVFISGVWVQHKHTSDDSDFQKSN